MLRTLLAIFLLLVFLVFIFSLPAVQTRLARKLTNDINETYGTDIQIGRVGLGWNLDVSLREVFVKDHHKDTLFYVADINTSILSAKKAMDGQLIFGDLDIEGLAFHLKTYRDEIDTNLDVFIDQLEQFDTVPQTEPSSFLLTSDDVLIEDSRFKLIDENKESENVLDFKELNGTLENFEIRGPDVSMAIRDLTFLDSRQLRVTDLDTDFTYTRSQMRLEELSIATKASLLQGEMIFDYQREDFADFFNKVKLTANFENSTIAFDEVNLFYNEFGSFIKADFNTRIEGVLNDFRADDFQLVSSNTRIDGDLRFQNLFDSNQPFFLNARLDRLSSNYYQLKGLLPDILGRTLPTSFQNLGQFNISGNTLITDNSIDAQLDIETSIGSSSSDLLLSNITDIDRATYSGELAFDGFQINKILEGLPIEEITLDARVDGQGFLAENLNTEISGQIFSLTYNGYSYKNLEVQGLVKDQLFDGKLVAKDPNLRMDFQGLADFSGVKNDFNFKAVVQYANLKVLNFFERDNISVFKGDVAMDMVGTNLDDLDGDIRFTRTYYKNQNDEYFFSDFKVSSSFQDSIRTVEVDSKDIIEGKMVGKFKVNELGKLAQNSIGSLYANYSPYEVTSGQFVDFNFKIRNKIIEVFLPEVKLGPNTSIRGSITAKESDFKLKFKSPQIIAYGNIFDDVDFEIDSQNPLYNTYVQVEALKTKYYDVDNFQLVNITAQDTLFFRTEFEGGRGHEDSYNLNFYHTIDAQQRSVFGMKRSDVTFKGNTWLMNAANNKANKVLLSKRLDTILIREFDFTHKDERIDVKGELFGDAQKNIELDFVNVHLAKVTPEIDSLDLDGLLNGNLKLVQRNKAYLPTTDLTINELEVNTFALGDLALSAKGNDDLSQYDINATLRRENIRSLIANGYIYDSEKVTTIDMDTELRDFDLAPFNPLGEGVIDKIRGEVSGFAKVTGNINNPDIDGELMIENGGIAVPYLNVNYDFVDVANVDLYNQTFHFNAVDVQDVDFKTNGLLDGDISHTAFGDWQLDLDIGANRLLVLNTKEEEESLYYGTAFMNGDARIFGATDNLTIKVVATSEAGTSIKIPVSDVVSIEDSSFIRFIDLSAEKDENGNYEQEEITGLELDFDLDVTKDAEIEIVVDKQTGSSLKGRGFGNLLMEINTNGKFNMWGDFLTDTGEYNFKYGGVISKKFIVQPGGSIRWEGDPYDALVDITAVYRLPNGANPSVLLGSTGFTRKIPTEVSIKLEGKLLRPEDQQFDINFPNTSGTVVSELRYRLADDQIRQLNALSLLAQGTFLPDNSFAFTNALGYTASETISSYINSIFNNDDGKVKLGVNYDIGDPASENQSATQDRLGVTLSTQISDRILINGQIGVPVGGVSESAVVGDVQIDFLLNEEGTLRGKVFNRENDFQFNNDIGYTQGLGLSYSVDFDNFKELKEKIFNGKKKKQAQIQEKKKDSIFDDFINFDDSNDDN